MRPANAEGGLQFRQPKVWMIIATGVAVTTLTGSCLFGTATNLCDSGRRCDPGQTCAVHQDVCIDIGGCGDGVVNPDKGEVCDDGNIISGDGCSTDCKSDETCGNHIIDGPKETCDDGNMFSGDGCSADCIVEKCGDSIYDPMDNEECDTGGDTQACNGNGLCTIPRCGDGYANKKFTPFLAILPEQCDTGGIDTTECNGNHDDHEGPGSCRFPSCGDSYINSMFKPDPNGMNSEVCDTGGDSRNCNGGIDVAVRSNGTLIQSNNKDSECQRPRCGDGYVNPFFNPNPQGTNTEACDAGGDTQDCNGDVDDVILSDDIFVQSNDKERKCQAPRCGDNYLNLQFKPPGANDPEQCDNSDGSDTRECNGNNNGKNGPGSCRNPSCGDGYTNPLFIPPQAMTGEQCDNGAANSDSTPDACRKNCHTPFCGDGVVDPKHGEVCDKGNSNSCPSLQQCTSDCKACEG